jgi:hypothetical protein
MSQPAHNFTSDAHAEARRQFEARKLTQDGAIWPVRRAEMRHGPTIRERMVEDLRACFTDAIPHYMDIVQALFDVGWNSEQVAAHSDRVTAAFRAARRNEIVRARP